MSGRCFVVTGASSGLGEHFSRTLAAEGHRVVMLARRSEVLARIAQDIAAAGGTAESIAVDVADAGSVQSAFERIDGKIAVLVNNAGVSVETFALDTSPGDLDRVIDTNLKGVFLVAQAAARRMRQTGGGAIVNVASILGLRVASGVAAYAASKAAVVQLTKSLALEWARHGIRVNALCPGYIETPLNREFFATEAGQRLIKRIPQGRLGRMSDLDEPLRLLCSDRATYITGTTLAVDGGHLVSGL